MRRFLTILCVSLSILLAQNWVSEVVDYVAHTYDCSIAADKENCPHIAYGCIHYAHLLKYARWNGSEWEIQIVDSASARVVKLCLDNLQRPHIAYGQDQPNLKFKYAYYDGNGWQIALIDSTNARITRAVENRLSMALSQDGVPHISYGFSEDDSCGVRYAVKSADSWVIQTIWKEVAVDSFPPTTAIDLDRKGYPVIAFRSWSAEPRIVLCARFNGQTWEIDTVSLHSANICALKVDDSNLTHICFITSSGILVHAVPEGDSWRIEGVGGTGTGHPSGDMALEGSEPRFVAGSTWGSNFSYKREGVFHEEKIPSPVQGTPILPYLTVDSQGFIHVAYTLTFIPLCYARREPLGSPIEERLQPMANRSPLTATIIRNVLRLEPVFGHRSSVLLDVTGRKVLELLPGANDIRHLSPGVYFIRNGSLIDRKVVITK